jgi:VWFA-related protein
MNKRAGLLWCMAASALRAQAPPAPTPDAVFHATTKLVQVNVIAQDKQGKPVADLRREDFQIFDNKTPQEIRLFTAEVPAPSPSVFHASNTFTNRPTGDQTGPTSQGGYTVILFDNLVTAFGNPDEDGTSMGALRVLKMLRTIPEGERVALYAIRRKLVIVHEFTTDRASLEQQLRTWKPSPDDAETGQSSCPSGDMLSPRAAKLTPEVAVGLDRAGVQCVSLDMVWRLESFNEELKQIADHLAGIPGRKNLIWMANRFPIVGGPAVQRLMNAGVAIYPVDEAGVCRLCPPRPIQEMRALAEMSGGVPFFERNDLDLAVREAIEDSRVSYTLGFYQPGEDKKPAFHQLTVKVNRPGITLRYRTSYLTAPPEPRSASPVADLVKALNRPMDATAIGVTAKATRTLDRLDLTASLDLPSLDLNPTQGFWKGKIEVVVRFMAVDGSWLGDAVSETATFNLRQATYESMLQSGFAYHKELKVPAKAVELKLLVGNLASGKIGTLTIPLSEINEK